jgi:hypothetical protein
MKQRGRQRMERINRQRKKSSKNRPRRMERKTNKDK